MIPANELKIGNWVSILHGYVQIEKFVNNGVHFTGCGATFYSIDPIPLTSEILEKAGANNGLISFLDSGNIQLGAVGVFVSMDEEDQCRYFRHIQSLHQLQNLYFALTGQELTINL